MLVWFSSIDASSFVSLLLLYNDMSTFFGI